MLALNASGSGTHASRISSSQICRCSGDQSLPPHSTGQFGTASPWWFRIRWVVTTSSGNRAARPRPLADVRRDLGGEEAPQLVAERGFVVTERQLHGQPRSVLHRSSCLNEVPVEGHVHMAAKKGRDRSSPSTINLYRTGGLAARPRSCLTIALPRLGQGNSQHLGACDNSRIRRRTAVRAALCGRAVHAARRRTRAGEGPLRGGAAGPDRRQDGGTLVDRDVRGARAGQRDEAAGCRRQRAVLRAAGQHHRRALVHRPDRHPRRGRRVRTAAARLAGTRGAPVLRRHRRPPGEHAAAPPVPHPRPPGRRFHRRGVRPARRRRRAWRPGRRGAARGGERAARRGHARHRRDDPGRTGRDHPARPPRGAGDRGWPRHREDRGCAAPRRVPALHPAQTDRDTTACS